MTPRFPVDALLTWFRANARVLPWREHRTPYRVWLSEIMLQQTRAEAVVPYFERFLAALPDIRALAEADEEPLLKLWEGLGYYSRVRNLRKAARLIATRHNGEFPSGFADIRALPGIGDYTAGAIASIAFGQPVPAVDGNVLRVLSRFQESRLDVAKQKTRRMFTEQLRRIYPKGHCGDFTESLMELGATVCLPNGEPLCNICPLASACLAHRNGSWRELPVKAEKKPRRIEKRTVLLIHHDGRIALRRRPRRGLLAGMMEFPNLEGWLSKEAVLEHLEECGASVTGIRAGIEAKHIFSHVEWLMHGVSVICSVAPEGFEWVSPAELHERISLPSAFSAFSGRL